MPHSAESSREYVGCHTPAGTESTVHYPQTEHSTKMVARLLAEVKMVSFVIKAVVSI